MSRTSINLSQSTYTNKDFNQVYPELLELAKELSYKWDPTISNESDPGVVLIKELALAIDKINYNTDKSALEQLPSTVQQPEIANELFRLLGYYPSQYKSAKEKISIQYKGTAIDNDAVIIPQFTMIQDESKEITYTTLEQINISTASTNTVTVDALEGILTTLDVSGVTTITEDMLDDNHRIYLRDTTTAQNGIFIRNVGDSEYSGLWNRVDNLELQNQNGNDSEKYCFAFGVDSITESLYIEFPEWISSIISSGLSIQYLLSSGVQGAAPLGYLTQFYNVNSFTTSSGQTIAASTENFAIQNISLISYGSDPETIDEMYRGYKKTCGTFDTLVTLRDYENAVYRSPEVSNDVVCDRTDDIQLSYKVQSEDKKYVIHSAISSGSVVETMLPYELKIYAMQNANTAEDRVSYEYTFTMPDSPSLSDSPMQQIIEELDEYKMMTVDFKAIEQNKMCLLTNVFDLKGQIYTSSALTSSQKEEVQSNIQKALFTAYNAKMIDFGEQIGRESILTTINGADKRIVSSYLDEIIYQTYVQYYDSNNNRKTICISDESSDYIKATAVNTTTQKATVDGVQKDPSDFTAGTFLLNTTNDYIYVVSRETSVSPLSFIEYSTLRKTFRDEIVAKSVLSGNTNFFYRDDSDFNYYTGQSSSTILKSVESVTTNTTFSIPLTEDVRDLPVPKNTTLQFSREKLYDADAYSLYIKYEFISPFKTMIQVNEDYQLTYGEYIIFAYKEDDNAEYYKAVVYGSGTIISPDFVVRRKYSSSSDSRIFPAQTPSSYPYEYRIDDNNIYLPSMDSISGTNQIKIKEYNQYVLNSNHLVYAISNVTSSGKYVMTIPAAGYTLAAGEYLFYTDKNKSYLNYIGEGTFIQNGSASTVTIQNRIVSSLEISLLGINAFTNEDFTAPSATLTLIEKEFLNLPEGTKITTTLQMLLSAGSFNITSTSMGYSNTSPRVEVMPQTNGVTINTTQSQSNLIDLIEDIFEDEMNYTHYNSFTLTSMTVDFGTAETPNVQNVWRLTDISGAEKYLSNGTATAETSGALSSYIAYSFANNIFLTDEVIKVAYTAINANDNNNISVINKIAYTLPTGETGEIVPGQHNWEIRAFLALNCGKDNPQYLESGQSLTIDGTQYTGKYVESINDLSVQGGTNVPVYTYDENLGIVYQTIRTYSSSSAQQNADMEEIFTLTSTSGNNTSEQFNLPIGKYILRIQHNLTDLTSLKIYDTDGTTALVDCNSGASEFKNAGIYFVVLNVAANTARTIKVSYTKSASTTEYVSFRPFIKVVENTLLNSDRKAKIISLDINKDFNYLYVTEDEIENPLASSSFMNPNHPYNRYIICKINNYKMKVMT